MARPVFPALLALVSVAACAFDDGVQFGATAGDPADPSQPGGPVGGSSGTSGGGGGDAAPPGPPATATDGIQNGDETDVDCGGSSGKACQDAQGCALASDCTSGVCAAGLCAAPSPTDQVRNGDETDVDCGGGTGKACAVGKQCAVHADCVNDACIPGAPYGKCAAGHSCRQHFGGETCGKGEPGEANAEHEDCCIGLDVPRPAADGGPFVMEKYLITAGRIRAFLEAVNWNPKAWVLANEPAWWVDSFTDMLPVDKPGTAFLMEDGGSGCFANGQGAPALWFPPEELAGLGDGPRLYSQDEMDTKVMNCFRAPLFHALCAFDGGRMPSYEEWTWAWQAGDSNKKYPWGDQTPFGQYAAQNYNYFWPRQPQAGEDWGGYLPAPGRFPQGAGPFGHMDLGGVVENMGLKKSGAAYAGDGWFQWSFQEPTQSGHPFAQRIASFGAGTYRNHWAVGGRCVKL